MFVLTYVRARMNTNGFLILPQWPTPLLIDKYGIQGFQMTLLVLISNEVGHCGRIRKPLVFIRARMYVRTKIR